MLLIFRVPLPCPAARFRVYKKQLGTGTKDASRPGPETMTVYFGFNDWNSNLCAKRARANQLQVRAERGAILAEQRRIAELQAQQAAGAAGSQITDEDGNVIGSAFFPRRL